MENSLQEKEQQVLSLFSHCNSLEKTYDQIIKVGQETVDSNFPYKLEENLVSGCQSELYLHTEFKEGRVYFKAYSEALISMGLAQLLIQYYNGEAPETLLKSPPVFLEKLNIPNSLTPTRANGLLNIHLRMKQEALKAIVATT